MIEEKKQNGDIIIIPALSEFNRLVEANTVG